MPTFQGQLTEEQLLQLIAYIKSLGRPRRADGAPAHADEQTELHDVDGATTCNADYGIWSWLLTPDHKRIAHPLPDLDHVHLPARRRSSRC